MRRKSRDPGISISDVLDEFAIITLKLESLTECEANNLIASEIFIIIGGY